MRGGSDSENGTQGREHGLDSFGPVSSFTEASMTVSLVPSETIESPLTTTRPGRPAFVRRKREEMEVKSSLRTQREAQQRRRVVSGTRSDDALLIEPVTLNEVPSDVADGARRVQLDLTKLLQEFIRGGGLRCSGAQSRVESASGYIEEVHAAGVGLGKSERVSRGRVDERTRWQAD